MKQNLTLIYPPHFFAQYRERIIQDDSISNLDLILLFASRIWAVNFGHIPPEHQEITKTWVETIQDENIDLMGIRAGQVSSVCPVRPYRHCDRL